MQMEEKDDAFMVAFVTSVPSSTAQAAGNQSQWFISELPLMVGRSLNAWQGLSCHCAPPFIYCIYLFIGRIRAKSLKKGWQASFYVRLACLSRCHSA